MRSRDSHCAAVAQANDSHGEALKQPVGQLVAHVGAQVLEGRNGSWLLRLRPQVVHQGTGGALRKEACMQQRRCEITPRGFDILSKADGALWRGLQQ